MGKNRTRAEKSLVVRIAPRKCFNQRASFYTLSSPPPWRKRDSLQSVDSCPLLKAAPREKLLRRARLAPAVVGFLALLQAHHLRTCHSLEAEAEEAVLASAAEGEAMSTDRPLKTE